MVRNSVDNAAYEGARQSILPGATATKVIAKVNSALTAVGIKNATVTVTPSVITTATLIVEVSVTVPIKDNAWVSPMYSTNATITKTCKLSRENALSIR